ncbi:MAG: histidine kinase, partial [Desulfobacterales bacterium]|nr:histidine kinase [Desulfobacterales bacterium]
KEVGKGTGLGLSIVYGIIKEHHGNITCHSEKNRETTFIITLPIMENKYVKA